MKKANFNSIIDDDMRPEYDFHGAVRGKHYKPLHQGYTVHIERPDGTIVVEQYRLPDGIVMIQPDIRSYFPDSEAVNQALRLLINLRLGMDKLPYKKEQAMAV